MRLACLFQGAIRNRMVAQVFDIVRKSDRISRSGDRDPHAQHPSVCEAGFRGIVTAVS